MRPNYQRPKPSATEQKIIDKVKQHCLLLHDSKFTLSQIKTSIKSKTFLKSVKDSFSDEDFKFLRFKPFYLKWYIGRCFKTFELVFYKNKNK